MKKVNPKKVKFLEKIINDVIKKPRPSRAAATYHTSPAWGWGRESNERTGSDKSDRDIVSRDDEEIQSSNG
tara:strand:- start:360 stop:572 length:213 start_codon:yes stop_codon:yes gene_type:complete